MFVCIDTPLASVAAGNAITLVGSTKTPNVSLFFQIFVQRIAGLHEPGGLYLFDGWTLAVTMIVLVSIVVVLSAVGGAFAIRRNLLSNAEKNQQIGRRPSVLAKRMADVRRTQRSVSPDSGRPPYRRDRQVIRGEDDDGGEECGGEQRIQPLSRRSFLSADESMSGLPSPAREDSPLLGPTQRTNDDFKDEEKDPDVDWGGVRGIGHNPGGSDYGSEADSRRTAVSAALTTLSAADEALLETFMEVLGEGLPIKIHRSSKRSRKTTLWLKDSDTLVWATKRTIGTKHWHKLNLSTMISVQSGKGGADSLIIGSGEKADETTCFSLTFPTVSMGFEAASQLERDALVQGFVMLAEELRAAAAEPRYRDAEFGA